MFRVLLLLCLTTLPAIARAEPLCDAPTGPHRDAICADANLRRLDARIRAAEAAIGAITPRPATLAARRSAFALEIEAALDPQSEPGPHALATLLGERLEQLTEQLRLERAMRQAWQQLRERPALESRCVGHALNDCRVDAAGMLASEDGKIRLIWQRQRGFTPRDGVRAGILAMERRGHAWRPLTWAFEGSEYGSPRLLSEGENVLLHIPGRSGGTGRASADLLHVREGRGPWREVESISWQRALSAHLPAGLAGWQGALFDPAAMHSDVPLWRDADALCCPKGGTAGVSLRIDGTSLAIASVELDAAAQAAAPQASLCPAERARYRGLGASHILADLLRAGPGTGAASDLLLRLRLPAPAGEMWFRFAQAVGYGGIAVLPVEPPGPSTAEDGIQDIDIEEDLATQLAVLPIGDDMGILADAPRSGARAPRHLLLPGLGRALHYGLLPQQAAHPEALRGFPTVFWSLEACRDSE